MNLKKKLLLTAVTCAMTCFYGVTSEAQSKPQIEDTIKALETEADSYDKENKKDLAKATRELIRYQKALITVLDSNREDMLKTAKDCINDATNARDAVLMSYFIKENDAEAIQLEKAKKPKAAEACRKCTQAAKDLKKAYETGDKNQIQSMKDALKKAQFQKDAVAIDEALWKNDQEKKIAERDGKKDIADTLTKLMDARRNLKNALNSGKEDEIKKARIKVEDAEDIRLIKILPDEIKAGEALSQKYDKEGKDELADAEKKICEAKSNLKKALDSGSISNIKTAKATLEKAEDSRIPAQLNMEIRWHKGEVASLERESKPNTAKVVREIIESKEDLNKATESDNEEQINKLKQQLRDLDRVKYATKLTDEIVQNNKDIKIAEEAKNTKRVERLKSLIEAKQKLSDTLKTSASWNDIKKLESVMWRASELVWSTSLEADIPKLTNEAATLEKDGRTDEANAVKKLSEVKKQLSAAFEANNSADITKFKAEHEKAEWGRDAARNRYDVKKLEEQSGKLASEGKTETLEVVKRIISAKKAYISSLEAGNKNEFQARRDAIKKAEDDRKKAEAKDKENEAKKKAQQTKKPAPSIGGGKKL